VANLTLVIVEGQDPGRELPIGGTVLIGRDASADLVIADTEVSSRHASVAPAEGGIAVEDLGSTNGTYVNGVRVTGSQKLNPGDRIQFGGTVVEVRGAAAAAPAPAAPPPAPPQQQPQGREKQIPSLPMLVFTSGQLAGSEWPVGEQRVVGRDPGAADIILDQDTDVSRRHASFSPAGYGLTVQDLGSTNGTYVNGHKLDHAVSLGTGDRVEIGTTTIDIRVPGQAVVAPPAAAPAASATGEAPNDIVVEGLVKQFGDYKAVAGIDLQVNPGEIYGFLGPNGAGKSTTVLMLTTLLPPSGGTARIAGRDVAREGSHVRSIIGVALQATGLDPSLNAWEHMDLQTALQGIPRGMRKKRAGELLERVGLTDAADRACGGYSGGMKRRLDLALALVHEPRVLFLDEPTTGLDPQSRTALWEEVARLVKEEATTVFLTTQYLEEADIMADRVGIIDHGEIVAEDSPEKLKAEIGRPTLEVVPVDGGGWAAVSEVLQQFGELVSGANKGVAVRLAPGKEDLATVIRALDSRGLRIGNVQLHAPTLDDVFLAKTGRSLEGAADEDEPPEAGALDPYAGVPSVPGAPQPALRQ
jgi:ABC-2 type transport system ATP-binding protein